MLKIFRSNDGLLDSLTRLLVLLTHVSFTSEPNEFIRVMYHNGYIMQWFSTYIKYFSFPNACVLVF